MTIHVTTAAAMLARFRAREAVRLALRQQGLKYWHYSAREISELAQEYQLDLRAKLTSEAQTQRQPNSTTSTVQMSGAK